MKKYNNVHFIGVGGISMSGLAKYLLLNGKKVSGSDISLSNQTEELCSLGAKIFNGHSEKNLSSPDTVVFTSAISNENPELLCAMKNKIPIVKRSELIGEILKSYPTSIAVGGSHGKTTATAMIANILIEARKNPTVFLGGEDYNFGNFRLGKNIVLTEACEYKKIS